MSKFIKVTLPYLAAVKFNQDFKELTRYMSDPVTMRRSSGCGFIITTNQLLREPGIGVRRGEKYQPGNDEGENPLQRSYLCKIDEQKLEQYQCQNNQAENAQVLLPQPKSNYQKDNAFNRPTG
jgi:hypothetical protein